jgi:hypothetical protein
VGRFGRQKIAEVAVYPYRFNAVSKNLKKIIHGVVDVSYVVDVPLRPLSRRSGTYVVITTNDLYDTSAAFDSFVQSKMDRLFKVWVITEDKQYYQGSLLAMGGWGGGTGNDAAENIRGFLTEVVDEDEGTQRWEDMSIDYLLLVGDPRVDSGDVPMKATIPYKYGECTSWSGDVCVEYSPYSPADVYPTDLYYAELSSDWPVDDDGDIVRIDLIDTFAEIAVGRVPVYNVNDDDAVLELDTVLEKIVAYETSASTTWRENVLLPMEPSRWDEHGWPLGEAVKDDILTPEAFDYFRIYDEYNEYVIGGNYVKQEGYTGNPTGAVDLYPELMDCTYENVRNTWTSDQFGLVVWFTHGWAQGATDVFRSSYAPDLDDTHPSFTFQASCSNASVPSEANLATALLGSGGIGSIAATHMSIYGVGQTEFLESYTNQGLAYAYTNKMVAQGRRAGDALMEIRAEIPSPPVSDDESITGEFKPNYGWINHIIYNLYGDPSLALKDGSNKPYNEAGEVHIYTEWEIDFDIVWLPDGRPDPLFRRGDANADGVMDISDALYTLGYTFLGKECPKCLDAADSNDDGTLDISDAVTTLSSLFLGRGEIPLPGRDRCGPDPTPDELGCDEFSPCDEL